LSKVSVKALSLLRKEMGDQEETQAEGGTVEEVLESLTDRYQGLRSQLFRGTSLNDFVNVFVNNQNIRDLDGVGTRVADGDRILLLPAVAGG
jgi:sulfur-carrier protein